MGKKEVKLSRLLALLPLVVATLATSCSQGASMTQTQPSAKANGTPLPLTQDGVIPAVPDPVEVYVVRTDSRDPKLVTVLSGVPTWAWSLR